MPTTTEFTDLMAEAQKQTLESIKQAQDWSIRAAELAVGLIPTGATFRPPAGIPKPSEIVEAGFGFASELLEAQKAYTLKLADVLTPSAGEATNGARAKR